MDGSRATGIILTAISALGFSTLAVFGVIGYQAGGNVVTVLAYRFLFATLLLWGYVGWRRRPLPSRPVVLQLLLMGGVGYTTMSVLYLASVAQDRLSPSLAALLLYTYPAIVTLLAWLVEGEALSRRKLGALLVTMVGLVLVLTARSDGAGLKLTVTGVLLALGAALVYSVYIFFGSRITRQSSPIVATALVSTAAMLVFFAYGLAAAQLVPMQLTGWLAVGGMALFATVIAVLCFFAGMERLGPAQASIISTLEPVGTLLLSALFLAERPGPAQLIGGLLVLAGILLIQSER